MCVALLNPTIIPADELFIAFIRYFEGITTFVLVSVIRTRS